MICRRLLAHMMNEGIFRFVHLNVETALEPVVEASRYRTVQSSFHFLQQQVVSGSPRCVSKVSMEALNRSASLVDVIFQSCPIADPLIATMVCRAGHELDQGHFGALLVFVFGEQGNRVDMTKYSPIPKEKLANALCNRSINRARVYATTALTCIGDWTEIELEMHVCGGHN